MAHVIYLYYVLLLFVRIMRQGMDLSYLPREQNDESKAITFFFKSHIYRDSPEC